MQPGAAAQIRSTIAPWVKACPDQDWDSLLALCTEGFVISGPGGPKVAGDADRPWLENYPIIKSPEFDFDHIEVSGDLAAANGSGTSLLEVDGQEVAEIFDFTDVFRRDLDGIFGYSTVIFNAKDVPA